MRTLIFLIFTALLFIQAGFAETKTSDTQTQKNITVYRSASCGCCKGWITHLRKNGFIVKDKVSNEMESIKNSLQIPDNVRSCHTGMIAGYTIEGHVPAADIEKLLREQPAVKGIATPGMPVGSPGMEYGSRKDPYEVVSHDSKGKVKTFSRHNF